MSTHKLTDFFGSKREIGPTSFDRTEDAHEMVLWSPQVRPRLEPKPALSETDVTKAELSPEDAVAPSEMTLESQLQHAAEMGRREGYEAGQQAALESLGEERAALEARMFQTISGVEQLTGELTSRYRMEAVRLGSVLAKAILRTESRLSDDLLLAAVDRAMAAMPRTDEIDIRCHPDDVETLSRLTPQFEKRTGHPISLRLSPTDRVERGGCIIEFSEGTVDAQPSVAVDVLTEAIDTVVRGIRETKPQTESGPEDRATAADLPEEPVADSVTDSTTASDMQTDPDPAAETVIAQDSPDEDTLADVHGEEALPATPMTPDEEEAE